MGTKGLITAFLVAFITVNVYKACFLNNITIKMPGEVPPNISKVFKDLIPFSISIVLLYLIDILIHQISGNNFAHTINMLLAPLFQAAEEWIAITIIFGAYAFSGL